MAPLQQRGRVESQKTAERPCAHSRDGRGRGRATAEQHGDGRVPIAATEGAWGGSIQRTRRDGRVPIAATEGAREGNKQNSHVPRSKERGGGYHT